MFNISGRLSKIISLLSKKIRVIRHIDQKILTKNRFTLRKKQFKPTSLDTTVVNKWQYFCRRNNSREESKTKRILCIIEIQIVFLMINYDFSYQLGYVRDVFDIVATRKSIVHC